MHLQSFSKSIGICTGSLLFSLACENPAPSEEVAVSPPTKTVSAEDSLLIAKLTKDFTPESHFSLMNEVFGASDYQIQTIGILVYDGVNDLDLMGPRYVLGQTMGATTQLIATEPGNVRTVMGVEMVPDAIIDSVDQLDILVIPGGFQGTIEAVYDEAVHDWIRQIDQGSTFTASVCTGGWILGATGLLDGKKATTNWYRAEEMLEKFGATFTNERFTRDGKYWTSAGVTAGMDMSLAIMEELWGERYAQAVMLDMEYDPAPPIEGGSPDKTEAVVYQMMKGMYDLGAQPLMDSLENVPAP